jgi:hypothetical protein
MKRSNLIIMITAAIAVAWTLVVVWMSAATIREFRNGEKLTYAVSNKDYLESQRKVFPSPTGSLFLEGDGYNLVSLASGPQLSVVADQ